jgi:hypothetical protein
MKSLFIEELDGITGATVEEAQAEEFWSREPEYDPETYNFRSW